MLTSEQTTILAESGVQGVFLHSHWLSDEIRSSFGEDPFWVKGFRRTLLPCIPFREPCREAYLKTLQQWHPTAWNRAVAAAGEKPAWSWRDGESSFLLPDGLAREAFWLDHEAATITRCHMAGTIDGLVPAPPPGVADLPPFPVPSFQSWMQGLRMLGFVLRLQRLEESLAAFTLGQRHLWLLTIGSDILSAREKPSPVVSLKRSSRSRSREAFTIHRSERDFEGEDFLSLLTSIREGQDVLPALGKNLAPHARRMLARLQYLDEVVGMIPENLSLWKA